MRDASNNRLTLASYSADALADEPLRKSYEFVFQILFSSGYVFGLVFSRRACYRLVPGFSTPVDPPRDKRGIVWSGNRGLRFGIGADNGRFHCETLRRERRRARRGWLNVEFSEFHKGRGAGKKTTPGGREKHAYFLRA